MKINSLLIQLVTLFSSAIFTTLLSAEQLPLTRLSQSPDLTGAQPKSLNLSADGNLVTYLQGQAANKDRYDLWQYNVTTNEHSLLVASQMLFNGEENLSDEEKARRERQRIFGQGIIEYQYASDTNAVLFPLNGDIYYYPLANQHIVKRLTNTEAFETDVQFSPKGNYVSFIREQNIYIIELATGKEIQLTKDGKGNIKNGMAEFIAQEEMDRMTGYWWSPDENYIAFTQIDESTVNTVIRNEIYANNITVSEQKYPATGTNNVEVKLATVAIKNSKINFIDLGDNKNFYLARVNWLPNSDALTYQWQSRDQKTLKLNLVDINNGSDKTILTETAKHWINLNNDLTFINDGKSFIWGSERDGFKHLYHFSLDGKLLAQLTKGDWVVDKVNYIDQVNGWVYFTGRADTPLESHLYKVPLTGSSPEHVVRITKRNGVHDITFAKQAGIYIDTFSNINTPTQVSLHKENGDRLTWINENKIDEEHPLFPYAKDLITPEFGSIKTIDKTTNLYYKLYKPQNMVPGKKYPAIVYVYGGPHVQRVNNKWLAPSLVQYFVQQGYVVFQLDNRGSNYRGVAFEAPIYQQLGEVEITDQIRGAQFLRSQPYVDQDHIGIYGHSYGGYLTIMALLKANDYFAAGVAGAPVTDWRLYDTHYTERYLNHPEVNSEGYDKSSVFPYLKELKGNLMIYHGMADDNVLFTHTTRLISALQAQNSLFELMTYPGSKHSMNGETVQRHLHHSIVNFFDKQIKVAQ